MCPCRVHPAKLPQDHRVGGLPSLQSKPLALWSARAREDGRPRLFGCTSRRGWRHGTGGAEWIHHGWDMAPLHLPALPAQLLLTKPREETSQQTVGPVMGDENQSTLEGGGFQYSIHPSCTPNNVAFCPAGPGLTDDPSAILPRPNPCIMSCSQGLCHRWSLLWQSQRVPTPWQGGSGY